MMILIYVNTWSKLSHFQVQSRDETNLFRYSGTVIVSCLKNKILSMKIFILNYFLSPNFLKSHSWCKHGTAVSQSDWNCPSGESVSVAF